MIEVPLIVVVLLMIAVTALWKLRRRVIDHVPPPPNIRPNDRPMIAHPDLTNPGISQPEFEKRPWNTPERRI
jgi:hypothetical protein